MNPPLTAGDIMTRDVAATTAAAAVPAAIAIMLERHVSGLPVLDGDGALVGILTEGDLLRRVELDTIPHTAAWLDFFRSSARLAGEYVESHSRVVGDVMTAAVLTVAETAPLADIVRLMQSKHIKRVPVMAGSRVVGMVSRADLLRALAAAFAKPGPAAEPSDAIIRAAILAEFRRQAWAPVEGISVAVAGGIVDLSGVIFHESDRAAMRVAAQNVAGVTSVRDHMIWVEPNSGMTFQPDTTLAE